MKKDLNILIVHFAKLRSLPFSSPIIPKPVQSCFSAQTVSTMRQLLHAFTIATIFAGAGATTTDLEISNTPPPDSALVDRPLIEGFGNVSTERDLQRANAKPAADNSLSPTVQEERGWWNFSRFRPLKDLTTVTDDQIAKYVKDEDTLLRAFKYLVEKGTNPQQAYIRLGGPHVTKNKEDFAMQFAEWGDANKHLFKLRGARK